MPTMLPTYDDRSAVDTLAPDHEKEFSTADLELAATLAAQGYEPIRIDGQVGKRRHFVFHDVPPAAVAQFHVPTAIVPAALFRSFRRLRQLVTHEECVTTMQRTLDHAHLSPRPLR